MAKNPLKDIDYPWEDSKPLRKALKPGKKSGALTVMKPEEFLNHANRLKDTKEDRLLIDSFKSGMKKGKKFKALKLLENNEADGRHRATAAEELGIEKVPVIDYRDADIESVKGTHRVEKATGGALSSDDPNRFMQDIMKFSFAILPLLRPGYLKEVPKQGFAHGGHVLEDDYPTHYLPEVGRQVMADGGAPASASASTPSGSRFAAIDPSMLVGTSTAPASTLGAYTDVGGQKIAAPYVTSMLGGYPVHTEPTVTETTPEKPSPINWLQKLFRGLGLFGQHYADGGIVDSALPDVEHALKTAYDVIKKNYGGYLKESKKIPNYGVEAWESDHDRLLKKMKRVSEDKDEYE